MRLGILAGAVAIAGIAFGTTIPAGNGAWAQPLVMAPLRTVTIDFVPEGYQQLIDRLALFAEESGFHVRVVNVRPPRPTYIVHLWRSDVFAVGRNGLGAVFLLGFFQTQEPVRAEVVDQLIEELGDALTDVPGAAIAAIE